MKRLALEVGKSFIYINKEDFFMKEIDENEKS
jgi:hypothetical protein